MTALLTNSITLIAKKKFVVIVVMTLLPLMNTYGISFGQEEEQDATTMPMLSDSSLKVEVVANGIDNPTGMAFLGPDDILVLERTNGIVQRIVNGEMLKQPMLDVNVNSKDERGLLGIAVSKKYYH